VADSLLRFSNRSVLLLKATRPTHRLTPINVRRILVPIDVMKADEELVARVVQFGEVYGAAYTLFHVTAPALSLVSARSDLLDGEFLSLEQAQARLDTLAQTVRDLGHEVDTAVACAPFVASEVLAYTRDHRFDLIAVGTRGPSAIKRMLLGSVSDKIIRGAGVPVLACNISDR
jgi:nucleotide-binding universal stress UspA family protein